MDSDNVTMFKNIFKGIGFFSSAIIINLSSKSVNILPFFLYVQTYYSDFLPSISSL